MTSLSAKGALNNAPSPSVRSAFYLPQLDGLRFIAFFLVFCHHTLPVGSKISPLFGPYAAAGLNLLRDACGFGLSLFFFLSAYLIGSLLILEKADTSTISLRAFYIRRVLRIWPLYFAFLGLVALVGLWRPAEHMSVARLTAMILLMGNWFALRHGLGPFVTGPLWSISVEEQFYAVWPSVFRALSTKNFAIFSTATGLASLGMINYLARVGSSNVDIWLNSFAELVFFAGGTLLAIAFKARRSSDLRTGLVAIISGLILWGAAEFWSGVNNRFSQPSQVRMPFGYFLVACGCALLLIGFISLPPALFPKWLLYLGKISYGLYVFHSLAIHIIRSTPPKWHLRDPGISLLLSFAITTLFASLSYPLLERPFLKLKRRFEAVKTRSA